MSRRTTSAYDLWRWAKRRAEKNGVPFEITPDDIVVPRYCPILGIELCKSDTRTSHEASATLDRINPTRGYVRGNVLVISDRANRSKSNLTTAELRRVVAFLEQINA